MDLAENFSCLAWRLFRVFRAWGALLVTSLKPVLVIFQWTDVLYHKGARDGGLERITNTVNPLRGQPHVACGAQRVLFDLPTSTYELL